MNFLFKTAMVTGGAGFIGSHIVEELVKMGVETISIDNYSAGKKENLAHLKRYNNFREVNCDITDYKKLGKLGFKFQTSFDRCLEVTIEWALKYFNKRQWQ